MNVGALIRRSRKAAGISQKELAQRAGTSQPAVAKIESGKTSPTVRTVERLMEGLGERVDLTASRIDSGVDRTQIAQGLRASPNERLARAAGFAQSVIKLQRAMIDSQR